METETPLAPSEEARINFPYGKCGDAPWIKGGCGAALDKTEEENGACHSYPECVLP